MAFCPNCGKQLETATQFCGACGKAVGIGGGVAVGAVAAPAAQGMTTEAAALLCYALTFVTGIIFLLVEPYKRDAYVRFHAFQAIFFGAALVALEIVLSIFDAILFSSAGFGIWSLMLTLQSLLWLAIAVLWGFLMYSAYKHRPFELPILGKLARQYAGTPQ